MDSIRTRATHTDIFSDILTLQTTETSHEKISKLVYLLEVAMHQCNRPKSILKIMSDLAG